MRDLRKYWAEIHSIERGLADSVWMTPVEANSPLVEVPASVAAKLLHGKSHRMATEEEILGHRAAQDESRRRTFHDDLRRKGIAVVPVEPRA